MSDLPKTDKQILKDLFSGIIAGGVCGVLFQPLDVIKTNLMILPHGYEVKNKSTTQTFIDVITIIKNKHGWKGFWMGTTPSAIRASLSCGIYFSLLRFFDQLSRNRINKKKKYVSDFLDSGVSRVLTSFLTNPLNVLKTKWAMLDGRTDNQNFFKSLGQLYKNDRSRLFVLGTLPMMCEEFLYGGIFNAIYEGLNRREHLENRMHKYMFTFFNGIIAGSIGAVLTQPFEMARIKIQSRKTHWHPPNGKNLMLAAFVYVYNRYGWRGFLRGFLPCMKVSKMEFSFFSSCVELLLDF